MTAELAITTIFGGFLLPFLIRLLWGKMVERLGAGGGWLAALSIVGTCWFLNHGMDKPFIYQTGSVWIDMAWAAAVGLFTASLVTGGKTVKSGATLGAAVLGGILAGFIVVEFF